MKFKSILTISLIFLMRNSNGIEGAIKREMIVFENASIQVEPYVPKAHKMDSSTGGSCNYICKLSETCCDSGCCEYTLAVCCKGTKFCCKIGTTCCKDGLCCSTTYETTFGTIGIIGTVISIVVFLISFFIAMYCKGYLCSRKNTTSNVGTVWSTGSK